MVVRPTWKPVAADVRRTSGVRQRGAGVAEAEEMGPHLVRAHPSGAGPLLDGLAL